MKIAINGFGRIGREVFKIALEKGLEVVAINGLSSAETYAYLLKYDSVYDRYKEPVTYGEGFIQVGRKKIAALSIKNPEELPWKKMGVDVVIESTGIFKDKEKASMHLKAGARKVIVSAPGKDLDKTVVMGVNHTELKKEHNLISMASCTTNCLAPLVKVLHDSFGVQKGFMTTVHAYTNDQVLLDDAHKKVRRRRAAAINLIPTSSGATEAVVEVIPSLKGKLDGLAIRAPVPVGSIVDFVGILNKEVTKEEVNAAFEKASKGYMRGILEYTTEEYVSSDIVRNTNSSIVDSKLTQANGNMVKVLSWYDNEFGYSNRMVDLLLYLKKCKF